MREILKKMEQYIQRLIIWNSLPVKLSFLLEEPTTIHFKSISKISLIWQNLRSKRLFHANFKKNSKDHCFIVIAVIIKGSLFHCHSGNYWWSGKTLSVLWKSILKPGGFFVKILTKVVWKLEKLKCQNFKKCMFDDLVIISTAFS